jgi:hypothetical protein
MPTLVDRLRAVAAASTDDSLAGLLWEAVREIERLEGVVSRRHWTPLQKTRAAVDRLAAMPLEDRRRLLALAGLDTETA